MGGSRKEKSCCCIPTEKEWWCISNDPCGICCASVTYFLVRRLLLEELYRRRFANCSFSLSPPSQTALLCGLRRVQRAALTMARGFAPIPPRQVELSDHLLPRHDLALPHDAHRPWSSPARVPAEHAARERAGQLACDVLALQRLQAAARSPLLPVRPLHHEDGSSLPMGQ